MFSMIVWSENRYMNSSCENSICILMKYYFQYETEDQALETRMALHGVRWPVSNPKNLFVDFSTEVSNYCLI